MPNGVRDYAKVLGLLAKDDVLGAEVICMFADAVNPKLWPTASDTHQALDALVREYNTQVISCMFLRNNSEWNPNHGKLA